MKYKINQPPDS